MRHCDDSTFRFHVGLTTGPRWMDRFFPLEGKRPRDYPIPRRRSRNSWTWGLEARRPNIPRIDPTFPAFCGFRGASFLFWRHHVSQNHDLDEEGLASGGTEEKDIPLRGHKSRLESGTCPCGACRIPYGRPDECNKRCTSAHNAHNSSIRGSTSQVLSEPRSRWR